MGEIPMPGGWMLSMAWLPMCGQTWAGAALSFVGMWAAMIVAMMLPSLLPALSRRGLARGVLAAAGYFFVWTVLGVFVFAGGAALAQTATQVPAVARAIPASQGIVILLAGALQFTAWKARHLACWRQAARPGSALGAHAATAWRDGMWLGLQCSRACAGLTAILLALGVMDWRAMALVTAAITAERLAPRAEPTSRVIGVIAVAAGLYTVVQAAGINLLALPPAAP
jgi:predicted metal-binding membrane protein